MKRKAFHIALSWLLVTAFIFAQIPFGFFHNHDHAPVCELTTQSKEATGDKAHYHNYVNEHCFFCSGYILKKDCGYISFTSTVTEEVSSALLLPLIEEHVSSCTTSKVSRGPPCNFLS